MYSVEELIRELGRLDPSLPVYVPANNGTLEGVNIGAKQKEVYFVGCGPDSGGWDEVRDPETVKHGKITAVIIE